MTGRIMRSSDSQIVVNHNADVQDEASIAQIPDSDRRTFPVKLHQMLDNAHAFNFAHIVSWNSDGKSFLVKDIDGFTDNILPRYFRQSKYKSFQRQLNIYGFRRVSLGPDKGSYCHQFFLRNRPDLHHNIIRKTNKTAMKKQFDEQRIISQKTDNTHTWSPTSQKQTIYPESVKRPPPGPSFRSNHDTLHSGDQKSAQIMARHFDPNDLNHWQLEEILLGDHDPKLGESSVLPGPATIGQSITPPNEVYEPLPLPPNQLFDAEPVPVGTLVDDTRKFGCLDPFPWKDTEKKGKCGKSAAIDQRCQVDATASAHVLPLDENIFPFKLYRLLQDAEEKNLNHIISWVQNGEAFKVHDSNLFCEQIVSQYFDQSRYESFRRQLNMYGFIRIRAGKDRGIYSHPLFIKGKRKNCEHIVRTQHASQSKSDASCNSKKG